MPSFAEAAKSAALSRMMAALMYRTSPTSGPHGQVRHSDTAAHVNSIVSNLAGAYAFSSNAHDSRESRSDIRRRVADYLSRGIIAASDALEILQEDSNLLEARISHDQYAYLLACAGSGEVADTVLSHVQLARLDFAAYDESLRASFPLESFGPGGCHYHDHMDAIRERLWEDLNFVDDASLAPFTPGGLERASRIASDTMEANISSGGTPRFGDAAKDLAARILLSLEFSAREYATAQATPATRVSKARVKRR